jgi:hypothetical protein
MNQPGDRWKYSHGLLLPKEFVEEADDRLDEIILRLPCYEPPNLEIEFRVGDILKHLLVMKLRNGKLEGRARTGVCLGS